MNGIKETFFLLFVTFAIVNGLPTKHRPSPCLQIDQSSKELMSETLLLLKKLYNNVSINTVQIKARWQGEFEPANYPNYINVTQRENDSMGAVWRHGHSVLRALLPMFHCAIRDFAAFPNTRGIVHKLKDLRWDTKNLIRHFQETREAFNLQQPANKSSDSICKMPSCNLRSHSPLGNAAADHGKAILEEIEGELLTVYSDVQSTEKQICP